MNDRLKMRNIKGNAAQMVRNLSNLELRVGEVEMEGFWVIHAPHHRHPISLLVYYISGSFVMI